jgi:hypothetical protein
MSEERRGEEWMDRWTVDLQDRGEAYKNDYKIKRKMVDSLDLVLLGKKLICRG